MKRDLCIASFLSVQLYIFNDYRKFLSPIDPCSALVRSAAQARPAAGGQAAVCPVGGRLPAPGCRVPAQTKDSEPSFEMDE